MGLYGYSLLTPSSASCFDMLKSPFALNCIFGSLLISVLGSMFHFTYQWTHCNWAVGLFVAVNESVFEHMKILSFPVFLFWLISCIYEASFINKNTYESVITHVVRANAAILSGAFCMGVVHLVVSVWYGFEELWFDITLFFISAFVAQCVGFYCFDEICIAAGAAIYSGAFFMGGVHLLLSVAFGQSNGSIQNSTEAGISPGNNSFIGNSTGAGIPPGSDVDALWVDVILFVVSVFLALCTFFCLGKGVPASWLRCFSSICLIFVCFCHIYFTDYPPKFMPVLFQDPGEFYGRPSNCTLLDGFTPVRVASSNSTS
jgi:hypothetical protein